MRGGTNAVRVSEQPLLGVLVKVIQHLVHRHHDRPPQANLQGLVNPHTKDEDDDLVPEVAHVGHVAAIEDPGHGTPFYVASIAVLMMAGGETPRVIGDPGGFVW